MTTFLALVARELRLSLRHGADTIAVLLFFLLAASLFPLAIGPEPAILGLIAPGVVWVCALLAAVLPLGRLFGADFEDGSLDRLLLCGLPAPAVAGAKALAHWLTTGLPLSRPSRNQTGISNAVRPRPYGLILDDLPIHIRPDLPASRVQTQRTQ